MTEEELLSKLDQVNAFHECGHARITLHVGAKVGRIVLFPPALDGEGGYTTRTGVPSREAELLIKLGGVGSELIYRGATSWTDLFRGAGSGDHKEVQRLLMQIGGDHRQVLKKAKQQVIAVLKERWDRVAALAEALRAHRILSGDEARSIIEGA